MKTPARIYLIPDMNDWEGVSWCDTPVTEEDVPYIRADLVERRIRRERLKWERALKPGVSNANA